MAPMPGGNLNNVFIETRRTASPPGLTFVREVSLICER